MTRVAIVGGGIAGLAAAASLAPSTRVLVLERETALGYHASGRSAAMFIEDYGNDTVRILNKASRPVHESLDALSPRGLMAVALQQDADAFEVDLAALGLAEVPVSEAHSRVPILSRDIVRAGYSENAQDIDTNRLLQAMASEARRHGATIHVGASVTKIERAASWHLSVGDENVVADVVVNAAGAWADEIAGTAGVAQIGLQPYRRSVARLPAPGGHDVGNWPLLMGPGDCWYAKPDAGGWIVSAAEEDPMEPMDAWADDMVLAEGIARYQPYVTEPVVRVETSWAGLRTFAPDRALVIGEAPGHPGFFWMAGQGGYGFQTAPAAAALLADLVLDRAPSLPADVVGSLLPSRFES
ncbi:MAG: FAD-dependent oxidoreductase [Boseongicola sp.]|nr:FAD-dependent oxidoreductase [Boseongicola sp.]MDE0345702.1 FAD-dependent oxidoreductase [Boseongicola sp.]